MYKCITVRLDSPRTNTPNTPTQNTKIIVKSIHINHLKYIINK